MPGSPKSRKGGKPRSEKRQVPWVLRLPGLEPVAKFAEGLDFDIVTPGFMRFMVGSALIMVTVAVVIVGSYAYMTQRNAAAPLPPAGGAGEMVDVFGGFRFYIRCAGPKDAARPTVVLDAGFGGDSGEYDAVQKELAKSVRVCAYDRQGYGYSELAPQPSAHLSTTGNRVASDFAKDLRYLLKRAGVAGPLVLVGHGPSAIAAEYYALKYGGVAGLVLMNPLDDKALAANNGEWKAYFERLWRGSYLHRWIFGVLGVQSVLQDFGIVAPPFPHDLVSAERQALLRNNAGRSSFWRAHLEEAGFVSLSTHQVHDLAASKAAKPLDAVPIRVLHSERFSVSSTPTMDAALADAASNVARLSKAGAVVRVSGDDTFPYREPAVVVREVQKVLAMTA